MRRAASLHCNVPMTVHDDASPSLRWAAILIAIAVLVPIVGMTLAVAAVAWIPLAAALVAAAAVVAFRARRRV